MPRRYSWDNRHTGALDALTPATVWCVCGWTGTLARMEERVERGSSVLSYYGPSPDWCYHGCPECGAEDDFAKGQFFKAVRFKRRLHIHHSKAA